MVNNQFCLLLANCTSAVLGFFHCHILFLRKVVALESLISANLVGVMLS